MEPDEREEDLIALLVDHVLPLVPPYEFALYVLLYRRSHGLGTSSVTLGKRSISAALGKSTRSSGGNFKHISNKLDNLASLGFVVAGEVTREGTTYFVRRPDEVPAVQERLAVTVEELAPNHYADPLLRRELFIRDGWRCHYCGMEVDPDTATLDHVVPQSAGGSDEADNLVTACLMCNSLKSGRTYEEAAPAILARVARLRREAESP